MYCLMGHFFVWRVCIADSFPFVLESSANDPKTLSLVNGEYNCVICVEHVTGEEKYDCEMLNVCVRESRRCCGKVCWGSFGESFFGFLYLYR